MNKSVWTALMVAILSGVAIGIQSTLNTVAGKLAGATLTGLLVNAAGGTVAGVILAAIYLRKGGASFANLTPAALGIIFVSGLLGIAIITGVAYSFPKTGVAAGAAAVITAQMAVAITVDTSGLAGGQPIPLSWTRLVGLGLLALGMWAILPRG